MTDADRTNTRLDRAVPDRAGGDWRDIGNAALKTVASESDTT